MTKPTPRPSTGRSTPRSGARSSRGAGAGRAAAERSRARAALRRRRGSPSARAVRDLQAAGLVERRAGSGTYVKPPQPARGFSFGLLIPDLGETEIFEPICQGMMASPLAREHALLWGSAERRRRTAEARVAAVPAVHRAAASSGVFFAPLELTPAGTTSTARIAQALDAARHPVVLLDRAVRAVSRSAAATISSASTTGAPATWSPSTCCASAPPRSRSSRVPDAARDGGRARGRLSRGALRVGRRGRARRWSARLDPAGRRRRSATLMERAAPDAIVCANDRTAARLMHTLLRLGYAIPRDVRLAGIDDVDYAALLPVPLTTLRQPTRDDWRRRAGRDARAGQRARACRRATSCCTATWSSARRADADAPSGLVYRRHLAARRARVLVVPAIM